MGSGLPSIVAQGPMNCRSWAFAFGFVNVLIVRFTVENPKPP